MVDYLSKQLAKPVNLLKVTCVGPITAFVLTTVLTTTWPLSPHNATINRTVDTQHLLPQQEMFDTLPFKFVHADKNWEGRKCIKLFFKKKWRKFVGIPIYSRCEGSTTVTLKEIGRRIADCNMLTSVRLFWTSQWFLCPTKAKNHSIGTLQNVPPTQGNTLSVKYKLFNCLFT
jgi:hypothetical protein